jgi:hypothetical protein
MRGRNKTGGWRLLLAAGAILLVMLWFSNALGQLSQGQGEKGRQQLDAALRRAAVACYAAEGVYPPTLDYLTQRYGVQIDQERYDVFYEIFADNLMPEITVVEKVP